MIMKLTNNRFLNAFLFMLLLYVIVHTIMMVLYAITSGDYQTLNSFRILGFTLFFHNLDSDPVLFFISGIIPIVFFSISYLYVKKGH